MTENEIFLKGIVIGASAIIPFIGIALGIVDLARLRKNILGKNVTLGNA
jgi:hypothetical protein